MDKDFDTVSLKILENISRENMEQVIDCLVYTGCPQKNFILLWKAIAPLKIVVGIKVGGVSESAGAELSVECQNFPVALQGAEIFEFKVDPVPNLTFFNLMSGVESNTFIDFKKA